MCVYIQIIRIVELAVLKMDINYLNPHRISPRKDDEGHLFFVSMLL